jgi:D-beta-D-heptose 7-phosphate kinase/D-beta-D-heptose 1-phosphate adenosyltransferase
MHLPPFDQARVLVAGDVMLDRYWSGPTARISPEAPVPVVRIASTEDRPGGAGNVALNVAALGAQAQLLAVTGADHAADALEQSLNQARVRCHFQRDPVSNTITKLRVLSRHQQLIRLDFEDGFAHCDSDAYRARFESLLGDCAVVVLSDYGKGTLRDCQRLIAMARAAGKAVLVDPKQRDFAGYHGATLITPNLAEFEQVVGVCRDEAELVLRGERLRSERQLDALLITRGEQGMTLLHAGHEPLHLPTQAREVYDVTGAGDTVIAVLAAALAAGEELARATALANLAAGIVVGKLGAATVSVSELRRAALPGPQVGVLSETQLLDAVHDARSHGETIVMTNGCFDLLHAGHVRYLEAARALGDRLIVAVNDDDSVRRLKGQSRPVNALAERMAVLAGLAAVDWVAPFSEDTPGRLICAVQPDFLVKGGDYAPEAIAGGDCVRARGGQVVVLPYEQGRSTSGMIERIREERP